MPSPAAPGRYDSGLHARDGRGSRNRHRPSRRRRFLRTAAVLLLAGAGTYVWADTRLNQQVDLGTLSGRVPRGEGTNYLVVGSDSREGLSQQDRKELNTARPRGAVPTR
ncbi:hypothetical protein ABT373_04225 [Streptomyces sp. NPDC000070]|uniref:hypothetical protein n=1 Tax=Streptomyces sp. NPDC000070 TaxID=3154240 RepID=UPI003332BDDE